VTSIPTTETLPLRCGDLGTLVVMALSGEAPVGAMPHLPGSVPGDREKGPEAFPATVPVPVPEPEAQAAVTVSVPVEPEAQAAFTGDGQTPTRAAHVLLPPRGLRA
jgi:hypothetical protein